MKISFLKLEKQKVCWKKRFQITDIFKGSTLERLSGASCSEFLDINALFVWVYSERSGTRPKLTDFHFKLSPSRAGRSTERENRTGGTI